MKIKYNDNELLYLISENDESAFEILCEKYKPLIISRMRRFKIKDKNYDDFYQECLMVLHSCAESYREDKSYTFNIYLDVSIQNKLRNLLRKDRNYFYDVSLCDIETLDLINLKESQTNYNEEDNFSLNDIEDKFEKEVIRLYLEGYNIKWIASYFKVQTYRIYYIVKKYKPKKNLKRINLIGGVFSNLEKQVYDLHSRNLRPSEIAAYLDCEVTIVYNAIKRIKSKSK